MKQQFQYKDVDQQGLDVLNVISAADRFNHWMYETIAPFCTGDVLEVGSGVGNISQYFIQKGESITLSDLRLNYRNIIKEQFALSDDRVIDLDIVHPDFDKVYSKLLGRFDSIFCLNVVEHIEDDSLAIKNMIKLLKTNGKLTVLVPAYQALYNGFDVTLEHFRRYNKKRLKALMSAHGRVVNAFYFNAMGILGWFVSGSLFGNKTIPEGEMKLYNDLVPVFKWIDKVTFRKVGLSVICVIEKVSD